MEWSLSSCSHLCNVSYKKKLLKCLIKNKSSWVMCQFVLLKVSFLWMWKEKKSSFSVIFGNCWKRNEPKHKPLVALSSELLGKLTTWVWGPEWDWLFAPEKKVFFPDQQKYLPFKTSMLRFCRAINPKKSSEAF